MTLASDDELRRLAEAAAKDWQTASAKALGRRMAYRNAFHPPTALALLTRAQDAEKRLGEVGSPLWAVHVRGPDDVVPVPSYEHAVLLSDQVNWWWAALPITENDAIISAIPMLWDGTAEQHAAEVVKLGTKASDYRLPTPEQVDRARDKAFAARVTHGGRKPA